MVMFWIIIKNSCMYELVEFVTVIQTTKMHLEGKFS